MSCRLNVFDSPMRTVAAFPIPINSHCPGCVLRDIFSPPRFFTLRLGVIRTETSLSLSGLISCVVVVRSLDEFCIRLLIYDLSISEKYHR